MRLMILSKDIRAEDLIMKMKMIDDIMTKKYLNMKDETSHDVKPMLPAT